MLTSRSRFTSVGWRSTMASTSSSRVLLRPFSLSLPSFSRRTPEKRSDLVRMRLLTVRFPLQRWLGSLLVTASNLRLNGCEFGLPKSRNPRNPRNPQNLRNPTGWLLSQYPDEPRTQIKRRTMCWLYLLTLLIQRRIQHLGVGFVRVLGQRSPSWVK